MASYELKNRPAEEGWFFSWFKGEAFFLIVSFMQVAAKSVGRDTDLCLGSCGPLRPVGSLSGT